MTRGGEDVLPRLKQLRQTQGLSQRALAEKLGVSQQSVNKYENHNIEPDIALLRSIADVFDTTIDYLVERTDEPSRPGRGTPAELTGREARLLDDYRRLSSVEQSSIDAVIANYMSYRNK